MKIESRIEYDTAKGEMNIFDGFVRVQIQVRKQLEEDALRRAVTYELEKLGYVVTSPEDVHTATAKEQFRVETRDVIDGVGWYPEGDHRVFSTYAEAEVWLDDRRDWLANPLRFEHRIVRCTVTSWEPVS